MNHRKVIAIDFDGCLFEDRWPNIGRPKWDVIKRAIQEKNNGSALILWTCREGKLLDTALIACRYVGLEFDAINDSIPEWKEKFRNDTRKIGADEYWDDKAVRIE